MRFHLVMLVIVILVSLGMHGLATAGVDRIDAPEQTAALATAAHPAAP